MLWPGNIQITLHVISYVYHLLFNCKSAERSTLRVKNESVVECEQEISSHPRPGGRGGRTNRPPDGAGPRGRPPLDLGLAGGANPPTSIPRKEVIQPHLPVRLPCYDFTPVTRFALDTGLRSPGWPSGFRPPALPWCDGRCVQGPGTYSPPCADRRLLATPPSWGRVAAPNPN